MKRLPRAFAPEDWENLSPHLRINVIYREMLRLDSETAAEIDDAHATHGKHRAGPGMA
jgi:hypothetical protein